MSNEKKSVVTTIEVADTVIINQFKPLSEKGFFTVSSVNEYPFTTGCFVFQEHPALTEKLKHAKQVNVKRDDIYTLFYNNFLEGDSRNKRKQLRAKAIMVGRSVIATKENEKEISAQLETFLDAVKGLGVSIDIVDSDSSVEKRHPNNERHALVSTLKK